MSQPAKSVTDLVSSAPPGCKSLPTLDKVGYAYGIPFSA